MSAAPVAQDKGAQAYLPDFCAAGALFIILLVAELAAIARIAADFLHRFVAHAFDESDDVIDARIVVAVFGCRQRRTGAQKDG